MLTATLIQHQVSSIYMMELFCDPLTTERAKMLHIINELIKYDLCFLPNLGLNRFKKNPLDIIKPVTGFTSDPAYQLLGTIDAIKGLVCTKNGEKPYFYREAAGMDAGSVYFDLLDEQETTQTTLNLNALLRLADPSSTSGAVERMYARNVLNMHKSIMRAVSENSHDKAEIQTASLDSVKGFIQACDRLTLAKLQSHLPEKDYQMLAVVMTSHSVAGALNDIAFKISIQKTEQYELELLDRALDNLMTEVGKIVDQENGSGSNGHSQAIEKQSLLVLLSDVYAQILDKNHLMISNVDFLMKCILLKRLNMNRPNSTDEMDDQHKFALQALINYTVMYRNFIEDAKQYYCGSCAELELTSSPLNSNKGIKAWASRMEATSLPSISSILRMTPGLFCAIYLARGIMGVFMKKAYDQVYFEHYLEQNANLTFATLDPDSFALPGHDWNGYTVAVFAAILVLPALGYGIGGKLNASRNLYKRFSSAPDKLDSLLKAFQYSKTNVLVFLNEEQNAELDLCIDRIRRYSSELRDSKGYIQLKRSNIALLSASMVGRFLVNLLFLFADMLQNSVKSHFIIASFAYRGFCMLGNTTFGTSELVTEFALSDGALLLADTASSQTLRVNSVVNPDRIKFDEMQQSLYGDRKPDTAITKAITCNLGWASYIVSALGFLIWGTMIVSAYGVFRELRNHNPSIDFNMSAMNNSSVKLGYASFLADNQTYNSFYENENDDPLMQYFIVLKACIQNTLLEEFYTDNTPISTTIRWCVPTVVFAANCATYSRVAVNIVNVIATYGRDLLVRNVRICQHTDLKAVVGINLIRTSVASIALQLIAHVGGASSGVFGTMIDAISTCYSDMRTAHHVKAIQDSTNAALNNNLETLARKGVSAIMTAKMCSIFYERFLPQMNALCAMKIKTGRNISIDDLDTLKEYAFNLLSPIAHEIEYDLTIDNKDNRVVLCFVAAFIMVDSIGMCLFKQQKKDDVESIQEDQMSRVAISRSDSCISPSR